MSDLPHIVWFKRDLRTSDHAALSYALNHGPTLPLYIIEPDLWRQTSASNRHWQMLRASLTDLENSLAELGAKLCVRIGDATEVLQALHDELGPLCITAHEETGEAWSFARDKAVVAWCRAQQIELVEHRQFGVFRGQQDRDGWAKRWQQHMQSPLQQLSEHRRWLSCESHADWRRWQPFDGPNVALSAWELADPYELLDDFLSRRGESYHLNMSSPLSAPDACSRLSAHLSFGRISMREVAQQTWQAQARARTLPAATKGTWPKALSAFQSRLHWHCHFMQKFESEPQLETHNMARSCDGLREAAFDNDKFAAWCRGETGYPFVDACMRYLQANGWINFRMRAMLVSFSAYDLWLHWRQPAVHLARLFTDFEPGIHYSQVQMQSGTTGINTLRIYNPVKQSMDQDPDGTFIRQWVPEVSGFDDLRIHAPWQATAMEQLSAGCTIGQDYPEPIVDHLEASRFARAQFTQVRRSDAGRADQKTVMQKHGSRKGSRRKQGKTSAASKSRPSTKNQESA